MKPGMKKRKINFATYNIITEMLISRSISVCTACLGHNYATAIIYFI